MRYRQRIAQTLLRLVRQVGRKAENGVLIDLPLTRQDLADMTGTTHYTVSRILSQWEQEKLIKTGRGRVLVILTASPILPKICRLISPIAPRLLKINFLTLSDALSGFALAVDLDRFRRSLLTCR